MDDIKPVKPPVEAQKSQAPTLNGDAPVEAVMPLTVSRDALLEGGSDQVFRQLVHDFFAFMARHQTIRDGHARRIGLAGIEYTILISLARLGRDGPVNVKSVADHLHVSTGFITNTTRKLQEMGLVEKTQDATDRRKTNLTVTAEGRERLQRLAPYQRQVNDAEFGALSHDDFLQLSRIIGMLVESSEQAVSLQRYLETQSGTD